MKRIGLWVFAGCAAAVVFASEQIPAPSLSADQIVERNIAAKGGLDAWRKIQTMVWIGRVDSANAPVQDLPFVIALKRPNKTRFEINFMNRKAVRVFDGRQGWKLSPGGFGGGAEAQPYTVDELQSARDEQVIDGLLIDHEAKGVGVTLDGVDRVAGRSAYRLGVKLQSGMTRHVWIDAETFLDVKSDRVARDARGQPLTVEVTYGNYRNVDGLQIPLTIESNVASAGRRDRLLIDKVSLNPPLEDVMFDKPGRPGRHNKVIDVDASPGAAAAGQAAR
ncbi:hypothetical protein WS71_21980 [Burkholderia mayonis]|uniref:Uncharacterized protein n=1 Tax=Burkholderia mayonis TaxID=1385591 RepID=A0A1B4G1Z1_9BURK|nr:hypothetical protein WS71_21980 [Burkholderia mayonis]KVE57848.1 hypothetical protein WS71_25935 [Burkholderia mayonis]